MHFDLMEWVVVVAIRFLSCSLILHSVSLLNTLHLFLLYSIMLSVDFTPTEEDVKEYELLKTELLVQLRKGMSNDCCFMPLTKNFTNLLLWCCRTST